MSVVSLRIGLTVAPALDPFSDDPVLLKWPNDIYAGAGKLAGTLLEARWRAGRLDWLAVGFGINVRPPEGVAAAALRPSSSRLAVLRAIVPALRSAVMARGPLTEEELVLWNERDLALGRRCLEPVAGRVSGIGADGAIHIETPAGRSTALAGSLVLQEEREEALP
jgi:BirA family biotin operon repressor/biotin-[acetyl-CoA-carboxylase] ligase